MDFVGVGVEIVEEVEEGGEVGVGGVEVCGEGEDYFGCLLGV